MPNSSGKHRLPKDHEPGDPARILSDAIAVAKSDWSRHLASTRHPTGDANHAFRGIMQDLEAAHAASIEASSNATATALRYQEARGAGGRVRLQSETMDELLVRIDDKLRMLHRIHEDTVSHRLETHHRGLRAHVSGICNRIINGREIEGGPFFPDEFATGTHAAGAAGSQAAGTTQTQPALESRPTVEPSAVESSTIEPSNVEPSVDELSITELFISGPLAAEPPVTETPTTKAPTAKKPTINPATIPAVLPTAAAPIPAVPPTVKAPIPAVPPTVKAPIKKPVITPVVPLTVEAPTTKQPTAKSATTPAALPTAAAPIPAVPPTVKAPIKKPVIAPVVPLTVEAPTTKQPTAKSATTPAAAPTPAAHKNGRGGRRYARRGGGRDGSGPKPSGGAEPQPPRPSLPARPPPSLFPAAISASDLSSLGSMRRQAKTAGDPAAAAACPSNLGRRQTRSDTPSPPRRDGKKRRVDGGF